VAHLLSLFTRGVPAYQVRWHVPVSLATVERAFRLFRQAIYDAAMEELSQLRSSGELELDETAFRNHRRGKGSWSAVGKVVVFGICQRDGHVVTFPVPNRRRRTPVRPIARHIQRGSIASADDFPGYVTLTLWGKHRRVTHKREQFFHGRSHINDIESFRSYVRMWLSHYRGVPRQYFPLYLKEIEWRFNHRDEDLFSLLAALVTRSVATV
jgi:transposase